MIILNQEKFVTHLLWKPEQSQLKLFKPILVLVSLRVSIFHQPNSTNFMPITLGRILLQRIVWKAIVIKHFTIVLKDSREMVSEVYCICLSIIRFCKESVKVRNHVFFGFRIDKISHRKGKQSRWPWSKLRVPSTWNPLITPITPVTAVFKGIDL